MYGDHTIPYEYENEYVRFSISKNKGYISYNRSYLESNLDTRLSSYTPNHNFKYYNEDIERLILSDERNITVCPIEPVNKPMALSNHLEIEFADTIIIRPKFSKKIFITFPIEVGIFLQSRKRKKNIDIITFALKKFTLYGPQNGGMICTYWKSDVFTEPPSLNPLVEGMLELTLKNDTDEWVDIQKAVFDSQCIKIYYSDSLVAMRAEMKILSKTIAETAVNNSPFKKEMEKSLELHDTRGVPIVSKNMIMEWGY